jgi:ABC-type thiamin/hydroxymethylpyrimidine transport system permease subunit
MTATQSRLYMMQSLKALVALILAIATNQFLFGFSVFSLGVVLILWVVILFAFWMLSGVASSAVHYCRSLAKYIHRPRKGLDEK